MTTQKYRDDSRSLLQQARSELAQGDVRQASEKGWGAVALMIKAVANDRQWEHGKHRHLSRAASRIRSETGERDVMRLFLQADALHGNFYEDELEAHDVAESLDDIERLLDLIEPLV